MADTIEPVPFQRISVAEVAAKVASGDDVYVIDLREPRQFHAGHVKDALLLPAGDFADRYAREIDPDDDVILICERGQTSEAAARFLIGQGFTRVSTMTGGMAAWNVQNPQS